MATRASLERLQALARLQIGKSSVLVATDRAARGLRTSRPAARREFRAARSAEDYRPSHRPTGRAGASGEAISLVCARSMNGSMRIEKTIRLSIPRKIVRDSSPI